MEIAYIPFHGCECKFCIPALYRLPGRFSSIFDRPLQFFFLVSVFFQTEFLQCPTHCALLKDALLNFSCGGMQVFMCLAWFLMRNRLHEFSIFHNGVPIDLYTSVWFVLAVFMTLLSTHIFLLVNVTKNTVSFSFFFWVRCVSGLCLLWWVCFFFFILIASKIWSLKKNMTTGSTFYSSNRRKITPWYVHNHITALYALSYPSGLTEGRRWILVSSMRCTMRGFPARYSWHINCISKRISSRPSTSFPWAPAMYRNSGSPVENIWSRSDARAANQISNQISFMSVSNILLKESWKNVLTEQMIDENVTVQKQITTFCCYFRRTDLCISAILSYRVKRPNPIFHETHF